MGVMIVLASPEFLYRVGEPPVDKAPGSTYAVDNFELASRLSFFLWSRLPDEELLALAEQGSLARDDVLAAQVKRMLADPRAESLVKNFSAQWLDVRGVPDIAPDPVLFAEFNPDLGSAFATELELFLKSVLLEDQSVLELLRSRETFVNERLALHYGIGNVRGDAFRRIELADENRWGLLGKGGILMATSYPNRTAPVLRGAWILEAITGTPPAAPPPNVEAFPENEEGAEPKPCANGSRSTARIRLAKAATASWTRSASRSRTSMRSARGGTKDRETATLIDSSGQLADGTVVHGPVDLRNALLANPTQFVQTLTEKLMTYGLGRSIEYYDMPAVRKVVREAAREDYRFSAILTGDRAQRAVPVQHDSEHGRRARGARGGSAAKRLIGVAKPIGRAHMFITKKHLSRRTVLRGIGATVSLPLLDAMIPARTALAQTAAAPKVRMGFVYFPHGAIMSKWTPEAEGAQFDLLPDPRAPAAVQEPAHDRERPREQACGGPDARDHAGHLAQQRYAAHQPRPVRRHHGRPDRGATHRPRDAAAVARGVDGRSRGRRRVRSQLRLQLRRDDLVPYAVHAAADGVQPAKAVPAAVRPGRHARRARAAREAVRERARRRGRQGGRVCRSASGRPIARCSTTISRACARSSGACRRWKRTTSRTSSCPMRRSASRTSSTTT